MRRRVAMRKSGKGRKRNEKGGGEGEVEEAMVV